MTVLIYQSGLLATDDADIGKAGPVGLFLIVSLLVAVFLLGRSMRTHLRRVPLEFPDTGPAARRADSEREVFDGEVLDRSEDLPGSRGDDPDRPRRPRSSPKDDDSGR